VRRLNALVYRNTRARKYVTFFFGRYTPSTGALRYVNAGHNPAFIVGSGDPIELWSTGKPIGIMPDCTYEEGTIELSPGSTLFLYTDGLNEAANADDEEFGMDRLRALVAAQRHAAANDIPSRVLDAITAFEEGTRPTDDKTIVVMRRI